MTGDLLTHRLTWQTESHRRARGPAVWDSRAEATAEQSGTRYRYRKEHVGLCPPRRKVWDSGDGSRALQALHGPRHGTRMLTIPGMQSPPVGVSQPRPPPPQLSEACCHRHAV